MMNRSKVHFGKVTAKPIEFTDYDEETSSAAKAKRERSQSSMEYKEALKRDLLKGPVTR
jgi:hypothetical protein